MKTHSAYYTILINIDINKEKIEMACLPRARASGKMLTFFLKEFSEVPFERAYC